MKYEIFLISTVGISPTLANSSPEVGNWNHFIFIEQIARIQLEEKYNNVISTNALIPEKCSQTIILHLHSTRIYSVLIYTNKFKLQSLYHQVFQVK